MGKNVSFRSLLALSVITVSSFATIVQAGTVLRFNNGVLNTQKAMQENARFLSAVSESEAKDFVMQFEKSVTEADKKVLAQAGIRVFRYVPDDALIIRANASQLAKVSSLLKINGVIAYNGSYKISSRFPKMNVFFANVQVPTLIAAFSPEDAKYVLSYILAHDSQAQLLDQSDRYVAIKMNSALAASVINLRGVEFVQGLDKIETLDMKLDTGDQPVEVAAPGDYSDINGFESGTKVMNFDAIWALGFHGEGQIVGESDTGLDSGDMTTIAPDFAGAIVRGVPLGVGAKSWYDTMGHGTHVAGSVASHGISSGGKIKGGAYAAKLSFQGIWSPIIDNISVPSKLSKIFDAAYADGARIHTNSWGSGRSFGAYDSMAQQVDDYMFNHQDFLVLFAAGNSGVDMDKDGRIDPNSIGSPGTAKDCLTVGASENLTDHGGIQKTISELRTAKDTWSAEPIYSSKMSDNINGLAMFSSRGPTTDGRIKPEIVAPGTNILSNRSHVPGSEELWGAYNADYTYSGGTSMSTPLVAGAAGVTRQVLMQKYGFASPSSMLVKATLMHTATDMYPGQYGEGAPTQELKIRRPNSDEGYGRVDMASLAGLSTATHFVDGVAVAQGESQDITVSVATGKLLINLVYNDAPGTPSAAVTLVNDLDLVVTGPDGKVYASHDKINNHEIFEKSDLPAGDYKVSVQGVKVPMGLSGKQPYALVYTSL